MTEFKPSDPITIDIVYVSRSSEYKDIVYKCFLHLFINIYHIFFFWDMEPPYLRIKLKKKKKMKIETTYADFFSLGIQILQVHNP